MNTIFFNGNFVDRSEAHVSVDDRGFLFGDGVYDVVRSYGGRFFSLAEHLARLRNGMRELSITGVDAADFEGIAHRLLEINGMAHDDATVYMQVTRGTAPRRHWFPDPPVPATVYASAAKVTKRGNANTGMSVFTMPDVRWARCDIKSLNILANCMSMQRAREAGGDDAILVRDGVALEGSAASLFGVFSGEVRTAPLTNYVLPSITRAVTIDICSDGGITCHERPIFEHELQAADELFFAGTTVELMPITRVNGKLIGDGSPGPVTRNLRERFAQRTNVAAVVDHSG